MGKVLGVERDQQGGIGIGTAPPGVAHAVGDNAALLRGSRHHIAPGTHAKGVHRPVGQVAKQLVIRRRQIRAAPAVLGVVDLALEVFDPDAHGKRFGLQGDALCLQHGEGVPGTVANGQDQLAAGNLLPASGSIQNKSRELAVPILQPGQLGLKPDFSPQCLYPPAQVLHHSE